MDKFKVIDPAGFYFNKTKHAAGAEIEIPPGPRLDAALHFKQVKRLEEKKPAAQSAEKK